ncbi:MAG: hypothetical protein AAGD00_08990 [Planctomycetota bacterium]
MTAHTPEPDFDPVDDAIDRVTGDAPHGGGAPTPEEETAAALHRGLVSCASMPASLRSALIAEGERLVAADPVQVPTTSVSSIGLRFVLAASLLLAAGGLVATNWFLQNQSALLEAERARTAALLEKIESNEDVIARARAAADQLRDQIASRDETIEDQASRLAAAVEERVRIAEMLAAATNELDAANLQLAFYEEPRDPAELAENRTKLLEVPGTVRMAWAPFDLPGDLPPAEQPRVTGDVVWNDEFRTGYLRFVGLKVNDPETEQYQVWVIDERGLEQKVSGGVFNATAQGEVIVPIEPGIDVGRVQLFAVTVENPGGTWVPDLQRRVVAAVRADG